MKQRKSKCLFLILGGFKTSAFTLIELLVVIAIVGILSGLIIVTTSGVTQKATIAKAQVFSNSLRSSLMINLVSEWRFDDASGTTANDSWGNIGTGTLYNFTDTTAGYGDSNTSGWMSSSNCVSGTCLKFDGSTNYITTASFGLTGTVLTFESWVKIQNKSASGSTIFADGAQSSTIGFFYLYHGSNSDVLAWQYADGTAYSSAASSSFFTGYDNTWVLIDIVCDYSGKTVSFYRNGVLLGSAVTMNNTPVFPTTNRVKYIGRYNTTHAYALLGVIDNIRLYNAALPTSQIKERYYLGLNSLLSKGEITKEDYLERIDSIAVN
jgi:prepilin-type N-terminal cleavage/methylation domain-containing protein